MKKLIADYPNYYITDTGEVWSKVRHCLLKPQMCHGGYLRVRLYKNGHWQMFSVHRLVLETFIGLCPKGMECSHKDSNPQNNALENLQWVTPKKNCFIRTKRGFWHPPDNNGTKNGMSKFNDSDIKFMIYMWWTDLFSLAEIGRYFKIHRNYVWEIVSGKRWKHIWKGIKNACTNYSIT